MEERALAGAPLPARGPRAHESMQWGAINIVIWQRGAMRIHCHAGRAWRRGWPRTDGKQRRARARCEARGAHCARGVIQSGQKTKRRSRSRSRSRSSRSTSLTHRNTHRNSCSRNSGNSRSSCRSRSSRGSSSRSSRRSRRRKICNAVVVVCDLLHLRLRLRL